MAEATTPNSAETPKGHPMGLYILFFTEMWERFSYYGMRALLMPYMISATFGYQPSGAAYWYKWYTSLVYLAPLLGGLIADRLIGARAAVLTGAVLMAVGHFLMAMPSKAVFFLALAFLIAGNGFFKPNISTMVGRMYKADDARSDRAFTIFYMGINLGAFLSSIICPWLRTWRGFDWGFGAAGVGMLIGLCVFFFGQKRVVADIEAAGNSAGIATEKKHEKVVEKDEAKYRDSAKEVVEATDADKPGTTGVANMLGTIYPYFMILAAVAIVGLYGSKVVRGQAGLMDLVMPIAFGAIFVVMAVLLMRLRGAQKDKSVSIFIMFLFPVLFWMAFEQAGTALNLWAEHHTNLHVDLVNKAYPAGWWQSANALMIFALAPVFTIVWAALAKRGKEPGTPWKMLLAMIMMVASFVVMVFGAASENSTETRVKLATIPREFAGKELDAKRLSYDAPNGELVVKGVLPEFAVRKTFERVAPEEDAKKFEAFADRAAKASKGAPVTLELDTPVFDFTRDESELKDLKLAYEASSGGTSRYSSDDFVITAEDRKDQGVVTRLHIKIEAKGEIDTPRKLAFYAAIAEPEWKKALLALAKESEKARVSGIWLFLSYLFATLGELCLSPVGLSMVTKLAPTRFASLFMGVWLLSSSVAQYVGGSIGESWGEIPPVSYFWIFVGTSAVGVLLTLLLATPLKKLMHEVR